MYASNLHTGGPFIQNLVTEDSKCSNARLLDYSRKACIAVVVDDAIKQKHAFFFFCFFFFVIRIG